MPGMIEQRQRIALPASALAGALVGPSRRDEDAVSLAREAVERLPIEIAPLDEKIAIEAARLRAAHRSLRLPDASVIATAITLDSQRLVTTDRGWPTRRRLGLRAALSVI